MAITADIFTKYSNKFISKFGDCLAKEEKENILELEYINLLQIISRFKQNDESVTTVGYVLLDLLYQSGRLLYQLSIYSHTVKPYSRSLYSRYFLAKEIISTLSIDPLLVIQYIHEANMSTYSIVRKRTKFCNQEIVKLSDYQSPLKDIKPLAASVSIPTLFQLLTFLNNNNLIGVSNGN